MEDKADRSEKQSSEESINVTPKKWSERTKEDKIRWIARACASNESADWTNSFVGYLLKENTPTKEDTKKAERMFIAYDKKVSAFLDGFNANSEFYVTRRSWNPQVTSINPSQAKFEGLDMRLDEALFVLGIPEEKLFEMIKTKIPTDRHESPFQENWLQIMANTLNKGIIIARNTEDFEFILAHANTPGGSEKPKYRYHTEDRGEDGVFIVISPVQSEGE